MINFIVILIYQSLINDSGFIKYKSGLAFFISDKYQKAFHILDWEESKTPIQQYIEVTYKKTDKGLINFVIQNKFKNVLRKSHRLIETAEDYITKRNFETGLNYLDSVRNINDKYPYLLHSYLYVYKELRITKKIDELNQRFNKNLKYYHKKEISDYYYKLYELWKHIYFVSGNKGNLNTAQKMLLKSLEFVHDVGRERDLKQLEKLLENRSDG